MTDFEFADLFFFNTFGRLRRASSCCSDESSPFLSTAATTKESHSNPRSTQSSDSLSEPAMLRPFHHPSTSPPTPTPEAPGAAAAPFPGIPAVMDSDWAVEVLSDHMAEVLVRSAQGPACEFEFDIPLATFIYRICRVARLTATTLVVAMHLMTRLFSRRSLTLRTNSFHRLAFTAMMVAEKLAIDEPHQNRWWAGLLRESSLRLPDVNALEVEFLTFLDWDLSFDKTEVAKFEAALMRECEDK
jgi:hypothetical protein